MRDQSPSMLRQTGFGETDIYWLPDPALHDSLEEQQYTLSAATLPACTRKGKGKLLMRALLRTTAVPNVGRNKCVVSF